MPPFSRALRRIRDYRIPRMTRKTFDDNSFGFESNPHAELHGGEGVGWYFRDMITLATASGAMRASAAAFEKSAKDVMNAATPGSKEDLATAIVGNKQSETAFKANLAVFKTADKMMGALLDTMA